MKKLTEESKVLLNKALETIDVYHISSLHPNVIRYEVSLSKHNYTLNALRYNYLLNNIGLLSTINNFFSYTRRLFEFFSNGNFANTLRQRINITHTLVECNGKTAVPVHISIGIRKNTGVLDLDNFDPEAYYTVTHPGYTRASGSVFLNIPLKNVLIYIKKEHRVKFIDKPYLRKINTAEDLLPYYNSLTHEEDSEDFYLDFQMPVWEERRDYRNNLKIHPPTDTSIFKLKRFSNLDNREKVKTIHPMDVYLENTFKSFDKFCKILFSAPIKLYTNNPHAANKSIKETFTSLIKDYLQAESIRFQNESFFIEHHNFVPTFGKSAVHPSKTTLNHESNNYKKLFDLNTEQEHTDVHLVDGNVKVIPLTDEHSLPDIVSLNNNKGIVFVVKEAAISYIKRSYYEFLYVATPDIPVVRTEDNNIQIINCSHPYWTSGEEYKEIVLPYSFFTLE